MKIPPSPGSGAVEEDLPHGTPAPVSIGQRGLWFLDHLAPGGTAYHLAAAFEVHGETPTTETAEAIRRAFARLHARHEALRTIFPSRDGEPVAVVVPDARLAWREHDLTGLSDPAILAAIEEAVYLPFDLERGPLFRVDFFAGPGGRRFLAVSLHHMVGDFSSLGLMLADLGASLAGEPAPDPATPAPAFSAFAAFQNGRLAGEWGEKLWAYWKKELAGLPDALDLPVDRARPSSPLDRAGVSRVELPAATAAGLERFAAQGSTPFTVLLAAFQAVLSRHTGAEDLAVGATLAGRPSRWPGAWETIGYFVNPLPLRGDLSGDPSFADLVARARTRAFGALRHQEMPLPLLMERRRRERGEEQGPFRVLLVVHREVPNWEDLPSVALGEAGGRLRVGASRWDTLPLPPRSTQFDLVLHAGHRRGGWGLALQYDAELFDATTAERLLAHFTLLLGGAVADPGLTLSRLPLLTEGERHQLSCEWNDTARGDFPAGATLPEIFDAQVAATPHRPAVSFGAERLTYAELSDRVNRLAHHLLALGVTAETPVGIFLRRRPELLFGLLAVMKAGGSYIPLDVYYPEDRLAFMLEDAGVRFVLTQPSLTAKLAHLSARLPEPPRAVLLDPVADPAEAAGEESAADPAVPILPGQAAYTIYTSGSTGRPKGVTVTHASLANMLGAVREHPGFAAADRLIAVTPISFDISTCEMFLPLTVGAEVTILPREVATDGAKLAHALLDKGITLLQVTPATWRMLLAAEFEGDPPRLRTISGGEAMSPGLARELLPRCREVWNMYGPTEATVWSTAWRVNADEAGEIPSPVPIGVPIGGTFAHVLDRNLEPVPVGVAGELLVGGRSLARGYLGRPDLTAERFIPDPFSGATSPAGSRLYRTGDLTRHDPRGDIVFLGRLDHQVKVRGFRIELGEVEAVLARHPAVRHEVVVARDDGFGEQMLAAYVVPDDAEPTPSAAELRDFLAETLPDHMVPAAFVFLPELPLTPSGKVDRKALPAPEAPLPQAGGEEPVGPVEELLAAIWSDLLHLPRIGRRDNFFELGGHSLLAARALARVREAVGVELSLAALFEEPTLSGFARRVEAGRRAPVPLIPRVPRVPGAAFPLSFAQERLWFLDRLEKTAAYNMPMALDLAGPLDVAALAGALAAVVRRHEALRTAFVTAGEEGVVQRILPPARLASAALPLVDLEGLAGRAARETERLSRALAARPFDLAAGPLSRSVLLRQAPGRHRLSWTVHHAAGDAWSLGVLLEDLAAFYAAALAPADPVDRIGLPPAPALQVADFAVFERRQGTARDLLPLWREHLDGLAPADLPADRPRPARRTLSGATLVRRLPALTEELAAAGRELKATPFMVLLAAYGALVARSTGESDFAVGTAAARRDHPDLQRTVGPFLNTLALRLDVTGEPTFADLAARARQEALFAYLHQDLPFERLVEALAAARDLSRPPLVSTMLVLQTAPLAVPDLPGLAVEVSGIDTGAAQLDLSLSLLPRGGDLEASLQYTRDLFDQPTVLRLLERFERLLRAALADPAKPVGALAWLAAAERHQLAVEWPATGPSPAVSGTVLAAFAAAAAKDPGAAAVSDGTTAWSYGELAAQAAAVAGRLAAAGVSPGDVVALAAGREAAWVAGMLGIWQAGAAYLPLDPALPDARLAYLLSDSHAAAALCSDEMGERLAHVAPQLPLAALTAGGAADDAPALEAPAGPRLSDLAYLIYTSGTTGRPKAVAVEHGQLAHLLAAVREAFGDVFARLPAIATFAFDISLFELLAPLTTGGTTVLVPLAPTLDVAALAARLPEFSAFHAVPAALRQIAEAARPLAPIQEVRAVFTGGDAVPLDLLEELAHLFPRAAVHVLYGPTEATVLATSWRWGSAPPSRTGPPLGRPLPGSEVRVLDARGEPVPIGVAGEIWIGGGGVARGYWKRPDLDAGHFASRRMPASPAGPSAAADTLENGGVRRFYRSGDRARILPDGRLEFLGRADGQVKVRGFRIEPGEIEAVLARQPGVREAVVLAVGEGEARRLVAYCAAPPAPPEIDAWKAALREVLPEYMVPQAFVVLPELPLAPTGKIDRKALAGLAPETRGARRYEPPADPVEETLAALWGELLGREQVGVGDDFFAEGGHSLLATRLASRIRTVFDVELPLSLLFDRPTVRGQAEAIAEAWRDGTGGALPPIAPAPAAERGRPAPLSPAQHRLWFLDRLEPGRATYNLPIAVALSGALSEEALATALAAVVARQRSLSTVFPPTPGDPVQVVRERPFVLPRVDLTRLGERAEAEAFRLAQAEAARPFDLAAGPLFRPVLLRVTPASRVLSATLHHIVGDGWSMGVFARELETLYAAVLAESGGSPAAPTDSADPADRARAALARLPALPIQYTDFARWQVGALPGILARDLAFWQDELAGLPARLELPTDHPRPAVQGLAGARREVVLPPATARALGALAEEGGATLFMVLLAGLSTLLARYSGQDDFAVGTPVAGRNRQELEGLIGFFVNTLVLRCDTRGEPSFADLVRRARQRVLAAQMHQELPFERLVEELAPERSLAHTPFFQVLFAFQGRGAEIHLPGVEARPLAVATGTSKFDWVLDLALEGEALAGTIEYDRALFDAPTIDRLAGHLAVLLAAAAAEPDAPAAALPLLTAAERGQLLSWDDWEDGQDGGESQALHARFERQVEQTPERVAASRLGESWTYRELNRRANRLARHLQGLGVGPEGTVGICLPRSLALVAAVYAVLKAGGAYVPLDPAYPAERLAFTAADARARAIVTTRELAGRLGEALSWDRDGALSPFPSPGTGEGDAVPADRGAGARMVFLEELGLEEVGPEEDLNPPRVDPGHLAYLIYTSGSTGRPKGVAIEHRSASALIRWSLATFSERELSSVLGSTSIGFDMSVFELFAPLARGGRVIVAENALELPELPEAAEITLVNTVPSAAAELARGGAFPASVETVNLGGEPLQGALVREVFARSRAGRVLNLYGPTEDTTYSTFDVLERGGAVEPTIGRLVAGGRGYVLDRGMGLLPVGVPGELFLGGAGVTRGYYDRPELTAERYVPDPLGSPGARLYRTGDRVRRLDDGTLDYLGRLDTQVKIRGFRVEPGEIEAALLAHPTVREVSVAVREEEGGGRSLVAWVALEEGADADTAALAGYLAARLPPHMVPAAFGFLPALPLLPNGKVDRRALAALDLVEGDGSRGTAGAAALGMLEETLAGVFEQVLGRSGIGRDESFFDLGGHSLLATQVTARLREILGVELPLRALFEAPTVAELAARVEEERGVPVLPPLAARPFERPAPLSFSQARLWLLDQVEPGSAVYNMPLALALSGPLDRAALAAAVAALCDRHEVLRTTFRMEGDQPVQVVAAPAVTAPLAGVDLSALPPAMAAAEALRQAGSEARRPFELERGPLLRTVLYAQGGDRHLLSAVMHHSISDGWSMGIFVRELSALYRAFAGSGPSSLPPITVQYADYALWQREVLSGERLAAEVDFWRAELAGLPPALELPLDHPRPPVRTWRGRSRPVTLPEGAAAALRHLARREGATLFMALLAAFEALLYRHSHQEDFAVGTPIAGRRHEALERLIGFFVNTLVLRADLAGNPAFTTLLERARGRSLAAQAHQDLPFEKLVEELNPERNLAQTPLFQAMLVLQNLPLPDLALPGLAAEPVELATGAAKFDLLLAFEERGEELAGSIEWNPDLFDDSTVARLLDRWSTLVAGAAADPSLPLADLPLLPAAEARQLFGELAGEGREFPRSRAIHGLVEEQAALRSDAVAVSFEGEQLTYGRLDATANHLAHRLRAAGCGLEVPAAVFLPRGLALPTALLAALKAGGPYVPIDADAPVDRLGYVLEDSGVRAILSHRTLAERLADLPAGVEVLWLDDSGRPEDIQGEAAVSAHPESGAGGNSGAYVIYTSGSTGRPKGVVVTHAEVLRLFASTDAWFSFGPADTWALFFSYAFDFSVWEIWGALMQGGRLAVLPYLTSRAPDALLDALSREQATVLNQTSSAFRQMIPLALEEGAPELALRTVVFGGEALDVPSLGPWFERFGDERTRMINMYGITETTVHTTYRWIRQRDVAAAEASGKSPIGAAMPDLTLYLLGPRGEPVPLGVPGEIAVGGDGLARGYLGRPELTAVRFVPDPYAPRLGRAGGARLYRSGDLARRLPDGDMEYLGRIDFQVKVRGFRVELGEIEAVLAAHPQVAKCAVLAREDRPGDRRLVGYAVPADPANPPTPEALRAALQERLPDYMVPAAILLLPELPLTVNGKLDRRALPAPDFAARKGKAAPPRNETEAAIAAAWKEVLGVPEVGVEDNFFDLGGHSLLLVQVHRKLKPDFPALAVVDLFRYPTIAALAGYLTAEKTEQLSLAESQARGQDRGNRAQRQRELRRQVGLGRKGR